MKEKLLKANAGTQVENSESNFFTDNFEIPDQEFHPNEIGFFSKAHAFIVDWQSPVEIEE
ncbi:MAG: hypothetical protein JEZ14_03275 [Marinilabiliaceae bacterium]|nr:hypothetical protein [Marinilabiliaceae bacterium]